ncbi:unannotated protein [freshwater metagenome]|uniref:Unannotated protein n=1 Tax=freshwater metagenome TaxID=449393 RepID=A0A6J7D4W8_9ZZZZ
MKKTLAPRLIALAAVAALAGGVLAACGSDNATGPSKQEVAEATGNSPTRTLSEAPAQTTTEAAPEQTTTQVAAVDGKAVFTENCAGCHTLKAAGSNGMVGPVLDQAKPAEALVVTRVTNGKGAMPAFSGQLDEAQITAVAKYVAENAGA